GRMETALLPSNFCSPSQVSPTISSTDLVGARPSADADAFTLCECRSRSGATPSNQRAPPKTVEASHMAWERGPMIGTLPSYQSPSTKVHVALWAGSAKFMSFVLSIFFPHGKGFGRQRQCQRRLTYHARNRSSLTPCEHEVKADSRSGFGYGCSSPCNASRIALSTAEKFPSGRCRLRGSAGNSGGCARKRGFEPRCGCAAW